MTHEQIIEAVEKMTVLELNDLVKAIEEKFGVSAASMAAPAAGGGGAAAAVHAMGERKRHALSASVR